MFKSYLDVKTEGRRNQTWRYYGTFKPMIFLLSLRGFFHLLRNPYASNYLKMLTVTNCVARISWNLCFLCLTLSTFFDETVSIETNIQGVIYSSYYMVNVLFIMAFNFHEKGVKLLREIKSESDFEIKLASRAFTWLFVVHLTCVLKTTYYNVLVLFDEKTRAGIIHQFYPFRDPNSVPSYIFLSTAVIFMAPGECCVVMYYSYLCVLIANKYKHFHRQIKEVSKDLHSPMAIITLELHRNKYEHIQNLVYKFNSIFSIYIGFNLDMWLLMICAIAYITVVVEFNEQLLTYSIALAIMLLVACLSSSMVQHEVSRPHLPFKFIFTPHPQKYSPLPQSWELWMHKDAVDIGIVFFVKIFI